MPENIDMYEHTLLESNWKEEQVISKGSDQEVTGVLDIQVGWKWCHCSSGKLKRHADDGKISISFRNNTLR